MTEQNYKTSECEIQQDKGFLDRARELELERARQKEEKIRISEMVFSQSERFIHDLYGKLPRVD